MNKCNLHFLSYWLRAHICSIAQFAPKFSGEVHLSYHILCFHAQLISSDPMFLTTYSSLHSRLFSFLHSWTSFSHGGCILFYSEKGKIDFSEFSRIMKQYKTNAKAGQFNAQAQKEEEETQQAFKVPINDWFVYILFRMYNLWYIFFISYIVL